MNASRILDTQSASNFVSLYGLLLSDSHFFACLF